MGCNSSKNLPKNNNDEPLAVEPTIRKGDQLTKSKEKDSSSNNNNESSSSGKIDAGTAQLNEEQLVIPSTEETKDEIIDAQRDCDSNSLVSPDIVSVTESAHSAGQDGDMPLAQSQPYEKALSVEEEKEEKEEVMAVVERKGEDELVPECSASVDSIEADLSDALPASASAAAAEPIATSGEVLATVSAEVPAMSFGSVSQPPSTFSTSSPMMARRKLAAQADKDKDKDGQRTLPAPSPFINSLMINSSTAGPQSNQSSEKTRQVASFLNPSPSIAFSKSMVTRGRPSSRHSSPAPGRRAAATATVPTAAEPEKAAEGGQGDLVSSSEGDDEESLASESNHSQGPAVIASESLLSEPPAAESYTAAVEEDAEVGKVEDAAESVATSASADKSEGDMSLAMSCSSNSSESTPARERLAKRLADMKKNSPTSPSAALSETADSAAPQSDSSPPTPLDALRGSGESGASTSAAAAAAVVLSSKSRSRSKSPGSKGSQSPGATVSRSASKSPSTVADKSRAVTRSRSADSQVSASSSSSSQMISRSLGSGSEDEILVGFTTSENDVDSAQALKDREPKQMQETVAEVSMEEEIDPDSHQADDVAMALVSILAEDATALAENFDLLQCSGSSSGEEFLLCSDLLHVASNSNSFHFPAGVQPVFMAEPEPSTAGAPDAEASSSMVTAEIEDQMPCSEGIEAPADGNGEGGGDERIGEAVELSPPDCGSEGGGEQPAAVEAAVDADAATEKEKMSPVEDFLLGKASTKHTKRVPISSRYPPSPVPRVLPSAIVAGKKAAASPPNVSRSPIYASPPSGAQRTPPASPSTAIERIIVQKFPGVVESPPKEDDSVAAESRRSVSSAASSKRSSLGTSRAMADNDDSISVVSALSGRSGVSSDRGRPRSNSNSSISAKHRLSVSPKPLSPHPASTTSAAGRKEKEKEKTVTTPLSARKEKAGMPPTPPQTARTARNAGGIADHSVAAAGKNKEVSRSTPVKAAASASTSAAEDADDRSVVSGLLMRSQNSSSAGSTSRFSLPSSKMSPKRPSLPSSSSSSSTVSASKATSKATGLPPTAPPPVDRGIASTVETVDAQSIATMTAIQSDSATESDDEKLKPTNLSVSSPVESAAVSKVLESPDSDAGATSRDSDSATMAAADLSSSLKEGPAVEHLRPIAPKSSDAVKRRASLTQSKGPAEKKAAVPAPAPASSSSAAKAGAAAASKYKTVADSKGKNAKAPPVK